MACFPAYQPRKALSSLHPPLLLLVASSSRFSPSLLAVYWNTGALWKKIGGMFGWGAGFTKPDRIRGPLIPPRGKRVST